MKRVEAACICQTLHFMLKEDISHEEAAELVVEEVSRYKQSLEKKRIRYRILEETRLSDDSVRMKIVKQYNQSPTGEYL